MDNQIKELAEKATKSLECWSTCSGSIEGWVVTDAIKTAMMEAKINPHENKDVLCDVIRVVLSGPLFNN